MAFGPVRSFALRALLWLPASFVLWFICAPLVVWPALLLAKPVLLGVFGEIWSAAALGGEFHDATGRVLGHAGYLVSLTSVPVEVPGAPGAPGGMAELQPIINPMIYGYALPLFAGLAMATPVPPRRRLLQLALALAVIWLGQAFAIVAESLKVLAFDAGEAGVALVGRSGIPASAIALGYQLGYLILPAVLPVALWIGLNRRFIEDLVDRGGNP
ncbi:MAG: hypothetical protein J0H15_02840 [Xanthomonadales bacterium]|nr:hypothetical protein [Xanthomonadales bacterium]